VSDLGRREGRHFGHFGHFSLCGMFAVCYFMW
jgi:hypothetical protein